MDKDLEEKLVKEANRALEYADSRLQDLNDCPVLYHYTTIEALFGGILVKDPESDEKAISLFASDHRYFNDKNEIRFGCEILRRIMRKYFNLDLSDDKEILVDTEPSYIISFSQMKDYIPMWSTYGNKGNGVALELDANVVRNVLKHVHPCIYQNNVSKYLVNCLENLKSLPKTEGDSKRDASERGFRLGYITCSMLGLIKHESYSYEKEVRYVTLKPDEIKYRFRNNLIIPYIIKYLPKNALKAIIVGPNLDIETTSLSLREYIDSLGFNNVEIVKSKVPFRNL